MLSKLDISAVCVFKTDPFHGIIADCDYHNNFLGNSLG